MVEIFGEVESSSIVNGDQIVIYRIPAISKSAAKARARGNNRLKGLTSPEITSVEKIANGSLPGQSIYSVEVTSAR